jgi:predicted enzyme related to lactoylglutathione lyase
MKLALTTIITQDLERMCDFYQQILQIAPEIYRDNYVMFTTETATLALWRQSEAEQYGLATMRGAANSSMLIEFEVDHVDAEYRRLQNMPIEWVQELSTFPWDHRAFYIRDPEGNVINFHSAV